MSKQTLLTGSTPWASQHTSVKLSLLVSCTHPEEVWVLRVRSPIAGWSGWPTGLWCGEQMNGRAVERHGPFLFPSSLPFPPDHDWPRIMREPQMTHQEHKRSGKTQARNQRARHFLSICQLKGKWSKNCILQNGLLKQHGFQKGRS